MQKTSKPKVAVIGLGNLGKTVATNLVRGNRDIILADSVFEKANELSNLLGDKATPMNVSDTIINGDILILALHFSTIKDFLIENADFLKGKIIIDPSNPIAPDENGGFVKTIGDNESSGQIISSLLPEGTKMVKALCTLGIQSLQTASHQNPSFVQFYANNDQYLNSDIEDLIRDNGFEPIRIGGIDQSIRIEVFGDLNEFGAIGKPVGVNEANLKI